ncbi:hypothetical protein MRX96_004475 [Rhipicephalus microplus]
MSFNDDCFPRTEVSTIGRSDLLESRAQRRSYPFNDFSETPMKASDPASAAFAPGDEGTEESARRYRRDASRYSPTMLHCGSVAAACPSAPGGRVRI